MRDTFEYLKSPPVQITVWWLPSSVLTAEIDHLHIHNVGYAAIVAKTDPNCERKMFLNLSMRNLSFHDNYIHHTAKADFM